MEVFEKEQQQSAVVHLLAELGEGDVALLLAAVRAEEEARDAHQVLGHVLLGLLLTPHMTPSVTVTQPFTFTPIKTSLVYSVDAQN